MNDKMVGQQFGPYRIEKYLESGGMATVYRAVDTRNGMIIALKILLEMYQGNQQVIQRFRREAKIAYELRHPSIVPMVEFGDIDGKLFMALRFMLGGSLADRLTKDPRLKIEHALHWMQQISGALDFAHSRGIIHRDLKPGNILLDEHNNAYLGDFGIARIMEGTQLTMTTQAQPGTVHFMSPEQISGGLHLSYHSDIYAMGVLAYLLLVGRFPFTGTSETVILAAHLNAVTRPPSQVNNQLPPMADHVIYRALEKDPALRFQSVTEFILALRGAIGNKTNITVKIDPSADNPIQTARGQTMMDTASRPPSNIPLPPNMPSTHPAPPRSKQNNSTWLVLFLLIFFIGGGIGLVILSSGENSDTPSAARSTDTPQSVLQIIPPTDVPRVNALSDDAPLIEPTTNTQGTVEAELTRLVTDHDQQTAQAQAIETELARLSVIALTTEAASWTSTPTRTPAPTNTRFPTSTATATNTLTHTPTIRPSNTPRLPTATPPTRCSGALVSRLEMGAEGRVTRYPNQANNMRDEPSTSGEKIGEIPPLGEFYVVSGPRCNDGYAWYEVNYYGVIGWTAESGNGTYWLEPWEIDN